MFTINFYKTVGVERANVYEGIHLFSQQVKFPYVPRIGESVKFPEEGMADEDLCEHKVENVVLNTRSREFEITLESFTWDVADADEEISVIEAGGFRLVSYEPEEPEEQDNDT